MASNHGAFRLLDDGMIDRIGDAVGFEGMIDRATIALYALHGAIASFEYETGLDRDRTQRRSTLRDLLPRPAVLLWHGDADTANLDFLISRSDARNVRRLVDTFEAQMAADGYERVAATSFLPERVLARAGYERVPDSFNMATGEWSYEKRLNIP